MKPEYAKNPIVKNSIEFSIMTIKYLEILETNKKFVIAKQLLRSATSIGASAMEAQSAESKAGFIHKLKIAGKKLMKHGTGFIYANKLNVQILTPN
jgi:four helix bundle protein